MKRPWTKSEDQHILNHYATESTEAIAKRLNRTVKAVYMRATGLEVKKAPEVLKEIGRRSANHPNVRKAQFKKGLEPWNAGTVGLMKKNETSFRPGNQPHNTKHDGALSIRTDSKTQRPYLYRRIALGRWVLEHRRIWESHNGRIPDNMHVTFKDGNTLNCAIENLECISRGENMNRNTIHNYPEDLKEIIRTITTLNKKIKTLKK